MGRTVEVPQYALLTVYMHDWEGKPEDYWEDDKDQWLEDFDGDEELARAVYENHFWENIAGDNWQWNKECAIEDIKREWPSFEEPYSGEQPDSLYYCREQEIILENRLVLVTISEYCGVTAISIVGKGWTTDMLAEHWVSQIEKKFRAQFGTLEKIGTASNGEGFYTVKED